MQTQYLPSTLTFPNPKRNLRVDDYKSAIANNNQKLFDRLIEQKVNPNKKSGYLTHPIFLTIQHDQPEFCKKLLDNFTISRTIRKSTGNNESILQEILGSSEKHIMTFLDIFKEDIPRLINLVDEDGDLPINYAYFLLTRLNDDITLDLVKKVVKYLLNVPNINMNKRNDLGQHPLFYLGSLFSTKKITQDHFIQIFRLTLTEIQSKKNKTINFNINLITESSHGSILSGIVSLGLTDLVEELLTVPNINPNLKTRYHLGRYSSLHKALRKMSPTQKDTSSTSNTTEVDQGQLENYKKICHILINDRRVDLNSQDSTGRSPLKYAIIGKHIDIIKLLLSVALNNDRPLKLDPLINLLPSKLIKPTSSPLQCSLLQQIHDFFHNSTLEQIMEIFQIKFQPPIPADRYHLVFLQKLGKNGANNLWLTEKADGVYRNFLPKKIYPPLHEKIKDEIQIEAEWMEELNLYLVFNIITPEIIHMNYWQRMNWLRSLHPVAKQSDQPIILSYTGLSGSTYRMETSQLQKFLSNNTDDTNALSKEEQTMPKWWPKLVFQVSNLFEFLSRQKIFRHDYDYDNGVYHNDGLIAVPELSNQSLQDRLGIVTKIKPLKHQTVDLLWEKDELEPNNLPNKFSTREGTVVDNILLSTKLEYKKGVWRCYWYEDMESWIPKDYRPEKKQANPDNIFQQIQYSNKNPITHEQLQKLYDSNPYYQKPDRQKLSQQTRDFLDSQKQAQHSFIKKCLEIINPTKDQSWIDLGFGNTASKKDNLWSLFPSDTKWNGVEKDPSCIWSTRQLYPEGKWVCGDFAKHAFDQELQQELQCNKNLHMDGILTINSAHFAANSSERWQNFRSQIDNMTKSAENRKSYWILVFLDYDLLASHNLDLNNENKVTLPDGGYVKPLGASLTDLVCSMEYKYPWAHVKSMTESVISSSFLQQNLQETWEVCKSYKITDLLDKDSQQYKSLSNLNITSPCKTDEENLLKYQMCFRYMLLKRTN